MTVEDNLAFLREDRRRAEVKSHDLLKQYVAARQKSWEALGTVDPEAPFTKQALARLEKALRDLEEFERYLAFSRREQENGHRQ